MKQSVIYNAAIYCRLSKDDLSHGESSSIQTQKAMLTKYITDNNWHIVDYYVDDGISGTTFERDGFKRLLDDIEAGKINMVVTKDLSRLGRDYLKTGYYTEVYFPENNVRYIALNDGIDTLNANNDIAPFKNILNEMYAKDISRKIKSAYKVKFARGDYHGAFAPFGYAKDPTNSKKLIIDPESAQTVRLIFDLAKQGYGAAKIRSILEERRVLTPSAYLHELDPKYYANKYLNAPESLKYAWWCGAVVRILADATYIGCMIHYKEISVSYKSKRRQNQPPDKWVTVENAHEPIIDSETWDLIRERFGHRGRLPTVHSPNIFARIVRCADCGRSMTLGPNQKNPNTGEYTSRRYFSCSTFQTRGKNQCTLHNTSYRSLYTIVLNDIRQYAKLALEQPDELLAALSEKTNKHKQDERGQVVLEYDKGIKRMDDLSLMLQRLFEDHLSGKINETHYTTISERYQKEYAGLEDRVKVLKKQMDRFGEQEDNNQKWVDLIAKYSDLQELDAPIVNELCEKILVHQSQRINGKKTQEIEIFYRFIGKLPA